MGGGSKVESKEAKIIDPDTDTDGDTLDDAPEDKDMVKADIDETIAITSDVSKNTTPATAIAIIEPEVRGADSFASEVIWEVQAISIVVYMCMLIFHLIVLPIEKQIETFIMWCFTWLLLPWIITLLILLSSILLTQKSALQHYLFKKLVGLISPSSNPFLNDPSQMIVITTMSNRSCLQGKSLPTKVTVGASAESEAVAPVKHSLYDCIKDVRLPDKVFFNSPWTIQSHFDSIGVGIDGDKSINIGEYNKQRSDIQEKVAKIVQFIANDAAPIFEQWPTCNIDITINTERWQSIYVSELQHNLRMDLNLFKRNVFRKYIICVGNMQQFREYLGCHSVSYTMDDEDFGVVAATRKQLSKLMSEIQGDAVCCHLKSSGKLYSIFNDMTVDFNISESNYIGKEMDARVISIGYLVTPTQFVTFCNKQRTVVEDVAVAEE